MSRGVESIVTESISDPCCTICVGIRTRCTSRCGTTSTGGRTPLCHEGEVDAVVAECDIGRTIRSTIGAGGGSGWCNGGTVAKSTTTATIGLHVSNEIDILAKSSHVTASTDEIPTSDTGVTEPAGLGTILGHDGGPVGVGTETATYGAVEGGS